MISKSEMKLAVLVFTTTCVCIVQPQAAEPGGTSSAPLTPKMITIRPDASALESLAANEVRRYVYLRTGKLMQVKRGVIHGERIVVAC